VFSIIARNGTRNTGPGTRDPEHGVRIGRVESERVEIFGKDT